MVAFWLLAALMVVVALAFILVPLVRPRRSAGPTTVEANLDVLASQRREIDADVAAGVLPSNARGEALSELIERARDDLAPAPAAAAMPARRPWAAAAIAAIGVPAVAFGMYLVVGTPRAADPRLLAADEHMDARQIGALVDDLAKKVRSRPDDVRGWGLLAQSLAALGRFPEAVDAYEHLLKLEPDDPALLADFADTLGMANGRTLQGRPSELVKRALELDPRQPKALALAGTAALDAGDFAAANRYWSTLAGVLPPGSEDRAQVDAVLQQVHEKAAAAGKALPAAAPASHPAPATASALSGSVTISPRIAAKVDPSATLFVFARAENGPRMPLALLRASAAQLPLDFRLDDSQSMAPNLKLSGASEVRIEARISRSGNAMPQPGDLVGTSGVVKPGTSGLHIVIDRVLP